VLDSEELRELVESSDANYVTVDDCNHRGIARSCSSRLQYFSIDLRQNVLIQRQIRHTRCLSRVFSSRSGLSSRGPVTPRLPYLLFQT